MSKRIVACENLDPDIHKPGDFQFTTLSYEPTDDPAKVCQESGKARLEYICPTKGNLVCGGILIGHNNKPTSVAPSWSWDGNIENPTLTPSIVCGNCGYHGYLKNGKFT